jgi:hypothetical protein
MAYKCQHYVNNITMRKATMLKAYAVALVLTTATPVATKAVDGVKAPEATKAPTTQFLKPGSIKN